MLISKVIRKRKLSLKQKTATYLQSDRLSLSIRRTAGCIRSLKRCRCCKKRQNWRLAKTKRRRSRSWKQRWTFSCAPAHFRKKGKEHRLCYCQKPVLRKGVDNHCIQIQRLAFLLLDIKILDDWMQNFAKSCINFSFGMPARQTSTLLYNWLANR